MFFGLLITIALARYFCRVSIEPSSSLQKYNLLALFRIRALYLESSFLSESIVLLLINLRCFRIFIGTHKTYWADFNNIPDIWKLVRSFAFFLALWIISLKNNSRALPVHIGLLNKFLLLCIFCVVSYNGCERYTSLLGNLLT